MAVVDVVIVEDHIVIRQMMAQVLENVPGFRLVGEASEPEEALELCRRLRPDMVILDLSLAAGSGIDLLQRLRDARCQARCLVFSGNISPHVAQRAFALGATGFAEKSGTMGELIEALQSVASGGTYFGKQIADAIRRANPRQLAGDRGEAQGLTAREREVLRFVAKGLSNKEMASTMGVSIHTVENHRANLIRKTGIQPPAKLALLAIQLGLIEPDVSAYRQ